MYSDNYDNTSVDIVSLTQLKELNDNLWYRYLSKSLKSESSWIDFEKEIFTVIQSFRSLFNLNIKTSISLGKLDPATSYIIKEFNFFFNTASSSTMPTGAKPIKNEYLIEYPLGSKNKIINIPKIIQELSKQLNDLANALKIYLKIFVENAVKKSSHTLSFPWQQAFKYTDHIITFNYTNTYEEFYKKNNVVHIHGNIDNNIVLGINPDGADNIETVDTTFITFKKYFQRVKYKTDLKYLEFIEKNKGNTDIVLYIIGHSLDITDKDIIQEIFFLASKIYILNYDETDESNHISNLVNIFGKSDFDILRRKKNITFMSITDNLNDIMRENSEAEKNRKFQESIAYFAPMV